ncbi:ATP-binding cassette domain-containing protein [Raineyella sp.]|uniref:Vitamin B12 import ATP-binding protein BtuD n=1 Tax=bioreactor metagenome TaxID=1076179 RepID=A0A645CI18_9ZZZZ|nr:ATP-binding cassette domain-containing protein [Raineyella sp.]MEA5153232.1 ATP-binding cassette domain-containing protein [Raineyella sp.]
MTSSQATPVAELVDVSYGYRRSPVLTGLDLRVRPGRVYGLLGRNGAGKSTTMKLLVGLLTPSSGQVRLFGSPFARTSLARVGASIDGPALYGHLSATQNLQVHAALLGVGPDRVRDVLAAVGLADTGRRAAARFSTGMKVRLALAIALLGDPELLILDEPQNGLDPEGIRELRGLLRDLADAGRAVLVSSHVLGEVEQIADDIGVLAAGRLQYEGPLTRLAPDGDLERAYFTLTETREAVTRKAVR